MKFFKLTLLVSCTGFGVGTAALAVSPAAVQKQLDQDAKITLVDVRPTTVFKAGHLPGAINIPASVVPLKQLPPMGKVVVYDEGLGRANVAATAADALNKMPGISAEVLEGGFAAWEMSKAATTKPRGMQVEEMPLITYQQLQQIPAGEAVLIDLRAPSGGPKLLSVSAGSIPAEPLTDLATEFPGVSVSRSPFTIPQPQKTAAGGASEIPRLLVLIDSGDGSAQAMARTLRANGTRRFVILAGGEEILSRHGQPGLQRASSTMSFKKPTTSPATITNR